MDININAIKKLATNAGTELNKVIPENIPQGSIFDVAGMNNAADFKNTSMDTFHGSGNEPEREIPSTANPVPGNEPEREIPSTANPVPGNEPEREIPSTAIPVPGEVPETGENGQSPMDKIIEMMRKGKGKSTV